MRYPCGILSQRDPRVCIAACVFDPDQAAGQSVPWRDNMPRGISSHAAFCRADGALRDITMRDLFL
jgi:hypothetical protein